MLPQARLVPPRASGLGMHAPGKMESSISTLQRSRASSGRIIPPKGLGKAAALTMAPPRAAAARPARQLRRIYVPAAIPLFDVS